MKLMMVMTQAVAMTARPTFTSLVAKPICYLHEVCTISLRRKSLMSVSVFRIWHTEVLHAVFCFYCLAISAWLPNVRKINVVFRYCILASCYIRFTLNICSFIHQCNTFTFYFLLIVDMFRPHTAIFKCYSILSKST
jgi:hypothetical protein